MDWEWSSLYVRAFVFTPNPAVLRNRRWIYTICAVLMFMCSALQQNFPVTSKFGNYTERKNTELRNGQPSMCCFIYIWSFSVSTQYTPFVDVTGLCLIRISEAVPVLFCISWCRQRSCLPQFSAVFNSALCLPYCSKQDAVAQVTKDFDQVSTLI